MVVHVMVLLLLTMPCTQAGDILRVGGGATGATGGTSTPSADAAAANAAAAITASTADPPLSSMRKPACAAKGCDVETTLRAKTGIRIVG